MIARSKVHALWDALRERNDSRGNLVYELRTEHRWEWRRFVETAEVEDVLIEWMDEDPQWPWFAVEIMAVLQSGETINKTKEPAPWAIHCHDIASGLPDWDVLHNLCVGSRWDSGRSAMLIGRLVLDEWKKDRPIQPTMVDSQEDRDSDGDPENWCKALKDTASLRRAIRKAVRQAATDAQENQEAITALTYGLTGSGITSVPPAERERLAKLLGNNPKLRKLIGEMGRQLRLASTKRRSSVHVRSSEITSIKTGQDLAHTAASELGLLGRSDTMLEFCRKYVEHQTLIYETKSRESVERGPIVVLLDVSGSMYGDAMTYAVATSLAICHTAVMDERASVVVPFDTVCHPNIEFTKNSLLASTLLLAQLGALGGGTDWMLALDEARRLIEMDTKWTSADIVLITDGYCRVPDRWRWDFDIFKHQSDVTLYGLLVEGGAAESLGLIADHVYMVNDVNDQRDNQKASEILVKLGE